MTNVILVLVVVALVATLGMWIWLQQFEEQYRRVVDGERRKTSHRVRWNE